MSIENLTNDILDKTKATKATMDMDTMDLNTMDLDTTDFDSSLYSPTNTKAELVYKLVTLLVDILWEVRIFIHDVHNLISCACMQVELEEVRQSLHAEFLLVNVWCNDLRMLDSETIDGPNLSMTMNTGLACEKILADIGLHLRGAFQLVNFVDEQNDDACSEDQNLLLLNTPHPACNVGKLVHHLREVGQGLHDFNDHVMDGDSKKVYIRDVTLTSNEEPLKMMWATAMEGLWCLKVEHPLRHWKEMFKKIHDWGYGQFAGSFPLDLYFDFVDDDGTRSVLTHGLFRILHYVGMLSLPMHSSSAAVHSLTLLWQTSSSKQYLPHAPKPKR